MGNHHRKNMLLYCLIMLFSTTCWATDFKGSTPTTGEYWYLYNVGSGKFLTEGNNWGTHATLSDLPAPLCLNVSNNTVTIGTPFGSGYMNPDGGVWMDQSNAYKWTFEKASDSNSYIIKGSTNDSILYYNGTNSKVAIGTMPSTSENSYWQFISQEELAESLSVATIKSPVNATWLFLNPVFYVEYGKATPWKGTTPNIGGYRVSATGTNGGNYCAEFKDKTFDFYQNATVKNGIYGISCKGFYKYEKDAAIQSAYLYANEASTQLPNIYTGSSISKDISSAAKQFTTDTYLTSEIKVIVNNGTLTIGVRKLELNDNDWTVFDDFNVVYYGSNESDMKTFVEELISTARELSNKKISNEASLSLSSAIKAYDSSKSYSIDDYANISSSLNAAIAAGEKSAQIAKTLKDNIETATELADANVADAISSAQSIYDNPENDSELQSACDLLESAIISSRIKNSTGSAPTVITDSRWARGVTMAFARSTITTKEQLLEDGVCYSKDNQMPTYEDSHTTRTLNRNGKIYWMKDLEPGTIYYVRAYAMTTSYAIGYGDVIRIITLPEGDVQFTMGSEKEPASAVERIKNAAEYACYLWQNLTSINGFHSTVNYSKWVPTAEGSYGGWISVGPSSGYQRTGTIMHEWLHGIGVGTHWSWTGDYHEGTWQGKWYGKRASKLVQFWENKEGEMMDGDAQHMSHYGINGSGADDGTDELYIGCSLAAQALSEDALIPVGGKFCLPAYSFEQEDEKIYCIKNSDKKYGLLSSYLVEENGKLIWKELTSSELQESSNGGLWQITFTPKNHYYQIRNVATGHYVTYNNDGIFDASSSTAGSSQDIHLFLSFVDGEILNKTYDTYHIVHPQNSETPTCLSAINNGLTSVTNFSNTNAATSQRWLILEANAMESIEKEGKSIYSHKLARLLNGMKEMSESPHIEINEGTTEHMTEVVSQAETDSIGATFATLESIYAKAFSEACVFLQSTTPTGSPYDISFLLLSTGLDDSEGWQGTEPTYGYSSAEYLQKSFDFYQIIPDAPAGTYELKVQGFQRPGKYTSIYVPWKSGSAKVLSNIYIGNSTQTIHHICDDMQESPLTEDGEVKVGLGKYYYIPNDIESASKYFSEGLYENTLTTDVIVDGSDLAIGIKGSNSSANYWTCFDNFRLYYYGLQTENKNPAKWAETYDVTDAMAPYLSTANIEQEWVNDGFKLGTWGSYSGEDGSVVKSPFLEKWVESTSSSKASLENASLTQTIKELPNGTYYIGGSFISKNQANNDGVSGVIFWASDQSISISTEGSESEIYSLKVEVTDGTLTFGLKTESTTANWVAIDNIFLLWAGDEASYYSTATAENPVRVPVASSRMEDDLDGWATTNASGSWWTMSATYENFTYPFMESWLSGTSLADKSASQKLQLKEGKYKLQAAVIAVRQNQNVATHGVTIHFDEQEVDCDTESGKPLIYAIEKDCDEGMHDIGINVSSTNANWVAWDNVILRYYGSNSASSIDQPIDNSEYAGKSQNGIYDLQGRKVTMPAKGIYIVNGKKIVFR